RRTREREGSARSRELLRRQQDVGALLASPEEVVVEAVRSAARVVVSVEMHTATGTAEGAGLSSGGHRGSSSTGEPFEDETDPDEVLSGEPLSHEVLSDGGAFSGEILSNEDKRPVLVRSPPPPA
ncbi:unnamed protein product, partial [Laminaria digitata]